MKVEFINFNEDALLDPEIKRVPLSHDGKNAPPSYCLPWVEAARYSIQLKSNHEYVIRAKGDSLEAWIVRDGKKTPPHNIWVGLPKGLRSPAEELKNETASLGTTPSFSSPWQKKKAHSVTLKLGVSWWTPPGWGLFFTSAVHRNEEFRVVEGMVRTDLWHKDIPIVIRPLVGELRIAKYSVVACALMVHAEDIELISAAEDKKKRIQVVRQILLKSLDKGYYKELVKTK